MLNPQALKRSIYDPLPENIKSFIRPMARLAGYLPFTNNWKRRVFLKNIYMRHIRAEHQYIFASITRFCIANRPINGYYFEFGCHSATTMRMAYEYFHHLLDWNYVAFDSFEGLPEIQEIDRQEIWEEGKLSTSESDFVRLVTDAGMPREKLITVKGFYDQTLNDNLKARLQGKKAAAVYIDCDLYASTVPVLEFVRHFLQVGTIIVFDDWNCFCGDPLRGERRAFKEFQDRYPQLKFEEFVTTHMQKAFIFVGDDKH